MKEVGTDPEAIKNALYKVQDYDGYRGKSDSTKTGICFRLITLSWR